MEILLLLLLSTSNIVCFVIGARVGQKVTKGETIDLPTINLLEAYRQRESKREAQAEQDNLETIMQNIERYDGTGIGQQKVG